MTGANLTPPPPAQAIRCNVCGRTYVCDPGGDCWCKARPVVLPVPPAADARCYCPCELDRIAAEAGRRT